MLHYRSYGNPLAPPLVFLHGFLGSSVDYLPLISLLKKNYYCCLLDLPAHGKSPLATPALTHIEQTLAHLQQRLAHKLILIGYSMGGRVALCMTQTIPSCIEKVLVFSSHMGLSSSIDRENRSKADLLWIERLLSLPSKEFLSLWYLQPTFQSLQKKPDLLQLLYQRRTITNARELAIIFEELSLAHQPPISTFSLPTGFVFGEEDTKYAKLYQTLPPSVFIDMVPNAGHAVLLENPMACTAIIERFLRTN